MSYIGNGVGRSIVMPGQIAPAAVGVSQLDGNVAGVLGMFKNKLINGNFDIWQRGTSLSAAASGRYLADRWTTFATGSTNAPSRQAFTLGQTEVPGEPTYFHRVVVSSVAGSGNYCGLFQRVEGVRSMAGQQIVLSFWAKCDSTRSLAVEFDRSYGSGGGSAYEAGIGVNKFTLSSSWQQIKVPVSIPSIAGKTIGTGSDDFLGVNFWFDAGSNFNARTSSLGQQSGTFDIAQVQLEVGYVATPFEQRPIGIELTLCQRYYQRYSQLDSPGFGAQAAAYAAIDHLLPVTMRTTPTLTFQDDQGVAGQVQYVSTNGSNLSRGVPQGANNSTSAHLLIWDTAATKAFMRAFVVQLNAEF